MNLPEYVVARSGAGLPSFPSSMLEVVFPRVWKDPFFVLDLKRFKFLNCMTPASESRVRSPNHRSSVVDSTPEVSRLPPRGN